jgi:transposase
MREGDITLNLRDQQRLRVLLELESDRMSPLEAASALAISSRQIRKLRVRLRASGAAGIIHGNRGRRPANACDLTITAQVVDLWSSTYTGFNQVFFTEKLEQEEGISISRSTTRRILADAGIGASSPQKRSRHRRHRVRRAQAGALIQMDGSDHDWLQGRGPGLTLVGGIDDATGHVWATFRLQEDTRGYLELLTMIANDCGLPTAVYLDRTTIALGTKRTAERVLSGNIHFPTQMTKVLQRLDIILIQARSPQAKGRIERLWRTLQDRLLCELRAKNTCTLEGANRLLREYLGKHNRHFTVPAINPEPAWRPVPVDHSISDLICWTYSRTVTNANTVSVDGQPLQLEFPGVHPGWARRRIQVCHRLDGTWFARHQDEITPATEITSPNTQEQAA